MPEECISIILPTCNSGKTLKYALQSIALQGKLVKEVIIVDCFSRDNTIEIINLFKNILNITLIRSKFSPFLARLIGVKNSNCQIIMFLDADQILSPYVSLQIVNKMIKERYDALILEEMSTSLKHAFQTYLINIHRAKAHQTKRSLYPRVFKRELLQQVIDFLNMRNIDILKCLCILYMFDDKVLLDLVKSSFGKIKIGFIEKALYHIEPITFNSLLKKYLNYGRNAKMVGRCINSLHNEYFHKENKLKQLVNIINNEVSIVSKDKVSGHSIVTLKDILYNFVDTLYDPIKLFKIIAFIAGYLSW